MTLMIDHLPAVEQAAAPDSSIPAEPEHIFTTATLDTTELVVLLNRSLLPKALSDAKAFWQSACEVGIVPIRGDDIEAIIADVMSLVSKWSFTKVTVVPESDGDIPLAEAIVLALKALPRLRSGTYIDANVAGVIDIKGLSAALSRLRAAQRAKRDQRSARSRR